MIAVVDAIIQHGLKRRAGGLLPPCDYETMLLKLAKLSPPTETLIRKLMGLDVDDYIIEVTKPSGQYPACCMLLYYCIQYHFQSQVVTVAEAVKKSTAN